MAPIERNFVMNIADFNNKVIDWFTNSAEEDLTINMFNWLNIIRHNTDGGCDNILVYIYNLQQIIL